MPRVPDMQFFRESGKWHRPEGAVRIKILVKGGDAGGSVTSDGTIIPGAQGQVVIKEMTAKEVGPTAPIEIGKAGEGAWVGHLKAPDGLPGYAVVTTYFKRHEMLSSLREFCTRIVRHVYFFVVGVVGGVIGVVSAVYADLRPKAAELVPLWVWLPILAGGFLVAAFSAFNDVRTERDKAITETEWRFDVMRYALQPIGVPVAMHPAADGTVGRLDIEVGLRLANNSTEYLRYEIEHMTVTIESLTVGNPEFTNRGVIIAPGRYDIFQFPLIRNVNAIWREGTLDFAVRYGHPSSRLQFRKSQGLKLTAEREPGPPGRRVYVKYDLMSDLDVEDV
jgi:hypothetical protein